MEPQKVLECVIIREIACLQSCTFGCKPTQARVQLAQAISLSSPFPELARGMHSSTLCAASYCLAGNTAAILRGFLRKAHQFRSRTEGTFLTNPCLLKHEESLGGLNLRLSIPHLGPTLNLLQLIVAGFGRAVVAAATEVAAHCGSSADPPSKPK